MVIKSMRCINMVCACMHTCRSVQTATHQGCQTAAIAAAAFLRDWLGPRIFAGRLSPEQQVCTRLIVLMCNFTLWKHKRPSAAKVQQIQRLFTGRRQTAPGCPSVAVQELMQRFVPSVPRANKACYVAVYDKLGSSSSLAPQATVQ
jgi:hypothetical protein